MPENSESTPDTAAEQTVAYLRTPAAIRKRARALYRLALDGNLDQFSVHPEQLPAVADYVVAVIRENYPTLDIPVHSRWRHFEVGSEPRLRHLSERIGRKSPLDQAKTKIDLAVTSVLLDAGAGPRWSYLEPITNKRFSRSEGLAVASFNMFVQGDFSASRHDLIADADGLETLTEKALREGFQVNDQNPLDGVDGRLSLLRKLGSALRSKPEVFGKQNPRIGNILDGLLERAVDNKLPAVQILGAILNSFSSIWPGRVSIAGNNLGDVWPHPALGPVSQQPSTPEQWAALIPFHKLSQWLTCSLLEPIRDLGIEITALDDLTGLAEYRNGGLFLDLGAIKLKDSTDQFATHAPGSPLIVAWRALTITLIDELAPLVRAKLGKTPEQFPLANMLEGGTWAAGRKIAAERRPSGTPPLRLDSDGTVF